MKGLVVYGSFHGCTEYFAEQVSNGLNIKYVEAISCYLEDIKDCDYIIIGSAIQKFKLHPHILRFLKKYAEELSKKHIFIFYSAINPKIGNSLQKKLPESIKGAVSLSMVLGARVRWETLSFKEKMQISLVGFLSGKNYKNHDSVNSKRIEKFIQRVKSKIE